MNVTTRRGAKRVENPVVVTPSPASIKGQDNGGDDNGDSSSECSMHKTQGDWQGEFSQWNGCCCGQLHQRPTHVFWIFCDGACCSWFNVTPECVGFSEQQAATIAPWYCPACRAKLQHQESLMYLLALPDHVWYHILDYTARDTEKISVLLSQIAPVCSTLHHAVHHKHWEGLLALISSRGYNLVSSSSSQPTAATVLFRPTSKRRRQRPTLEAIQDAHTLLRNRTDDAHVALVAMADSVQEPLTLARLRRVLATGGSKNSRADNQNSKNKMNQHSVSSISRILIDRRSSFGRTFLHACCAADYVNEGVVWRCVRLLLQDHGADPNKFTTAEHPDANRPALFFAISRVMPKVVQELVSQGASVTVPVSGCFRWVSDPARMFTGTFTPLEFARHLRDMEEMGSSHQSNEGRSLLETQRKKHLPKYWMRKLNECISILEKAAGDGT